MIQNVMYKLDDADIVDARWRKRLRQAHGMIRWDDETEDALIAIVSNNGISPADVDKAVAALTEEYACLGRELGEEKITDARCRVVEHQRFVLLDSIWILGEIQKLMRKDIALGEAA